MDYSVKRSYRGGILVAPPGAPPVSGEWRTSKDNKRYFYTNRKDVEAYGRPSSAGDSLKGDSSGLADWKAAMAAIGVLMSKEAASLITTLINQYDGDPYYRGDDGGTESGKSRLKRAVEKACDVAGASSAAALGSEFHGLWELLNHGKQPRLIQPHLVPLVNHYQERVKPIRFIDAEVLIVNDQVKRAGSMDHFMELPAGLETPDGVVHDEPMLVCGDGKGLPLDTKIPTPTGWTTMGELSVGDEVFSSDGGICKVTVKSAIKNIGTWVVSFDDGSKVVCDTEHLWWTQSGLSKSVKESVLPVGEIARTVRDSKGRAQHRVPVAESLKLPYVDLPIDPYLLGAWLGDGNQGRGVITKEDDLFDILESDGHRLGVRYADKRSGVPSRSVLGLQSQLRAAGLLSNKHVPDKYLRADYQQRLRLLQGLMDTDGHWNKVRRSATFHSTSKTLALSTEELLHTLGQRPRLHERLMRGFGKEVLCYTVEFTPVDLVPFRLPRKAKPCREMLADKNVTRSRRRLITSVEPGPDVPTVCIGVDSRNSTYLCTENFVPTHNTGKWDAMYPAGIYAQLATYALGYRYNQETNERLPIHPDLNRKWGVMIHYPLTAKDPMVEFYWIDLELGLKAALLNNQIAEMINFLKSAQGKPKKFELPYD